MVACLVTLTDLSTRCEGLFVLAALLVSVSRRSGVWQCGTYTYISATRAVYIRFSQLEKQIRFQIH